MFQQSLGKVYLVTELAATEKLLYIFLNQKYLEIKGKIFTLEDQMVVQKALQLNTRNALLLGMLTAPD